MTEVIIVKNEREAGDIYGRSVADLIKTKPNAVLGLATGSSPLAAYRSLALCTASILTYRRCVVSHWTNIWDCRLITRSHIIPPFTARSWNRLD